MKEDIQAEMAAISTAYESLYDRYIQALAEIDRLKKASLNSIHAAHDNR